MSFRRAIVVLCTLAATLLLGLPPAIADDAPVPETAPVTFVDIVDSPHEAAVTALAELGIVRGCEEERFCSRDELTRGQVASIVVRALQLPTTHTLAPGTFTIATPPFDDVDGSVHAVAILAVASAGLMAGCEEGRFCPNDPITRQQLATTLQAAFDVPDAPEGKSYFTDTDGPHQPAIASITKAGIASGCGLVAFCPEEPLQRAQAAMFIARGLDLVDRVEVAPFEERLAEHEAQLEAERKIAEEKAAKTAAHNPGARAVEVALAQLGKPYRWGGSGPGSFDCSGLTSFAWRAAGVELPRSSRLQYGATTRISRSELRPGDLVFYHSPISHVAMYIGDGKVVESPNSGNNVRIRNDGLTRRGVVGYGRP